MNRGGLPSDAHITFSSSIGLIYEDDEAPEHILDPFHIQQCLRIDETKREKK